ncbi:MAG TPA: pca operon transcription factor PcaQ [Amaricoccus sp.]|jgi:LysR family pca operon transcriptional activator|nr:pca operon transcription factor PcaQ [Amaricoccus sp.]
MVPITYRHVRCFLEVARLQSVQQAADALAISQPAVSKTLRELEERVGAALFERAGRRLRLTAAGRIFQKHAGLSLTELDRGIRAVRGPVAGGVVSAGVLPTVATRILPRAALAFARAVPEACLRASTGPNSYLLSQLREGTLDLVVGRLAAPREMAGLVFEQLYAEEVVAVVRAGHPILDGPGTDLADWPLILPPPGAIIRPVVEQHFLSHGRELPAPKVETVSLALGRGLVLASDAIWFISRGVVAEEIAAGGIVVLDLGGLPLAGPVGLTLRSGQAVSDALAVLMQMLREAAQVEHPVP